MLTGLLIILWPKYCWTPPTVDVIIVGDSAVMSWTETRNHPAIYFRPNDLPCLLCNRAVSRALVVVDYPFGTLSKLIQRRFAFSIRIMKESGGHFAVKVEGGQEIKESVNKRI